MLKKLANRSLFMTTLMITLLLIVALSTATFAWFSANNIVNVSSISFMADTDEGFGELAIAWDRSMTDEYRIDFAAPFEDENKKLYPMMPIVMPVRGVTTFDQFAISGYPNMGQTLGDDIYNDRCFTYGIQTSVLDELTGTYSTKYQYDGDFSHPYICKNKDNFNQSDFYLINKNIYHNQDITIEYTITGSLANKLCVAVFVDDFFQGVLTNLSGIHYGTIKKDSNVSSTLMSTNACYSSENLKFNIKKNDAALIRLVAWYDGVPVENSDSGSTATISMLKFKGNPSEPD